MGISVGTSGYNYPEWRGTFYPAGMKPPAMFGYYSQQFSTVEINYTFYRMPTPKLTAAWLAQAPAGFTYTLKAPKRITHELRLKEECRDALNYFVEAARVLGPHLAGLLFQLPPTMKCDPARFAAFLAMLPDGINASFEFRHDSWLTDEVFGMLEGRGAALCIADFGDRTTPLRATARHGYFRLRDEGYTPADLERWADMVIERLPSWQDVFVYFKHEEDGKGPEFARAFIDALVRKGF